LTLRTACPGEDRQTVLRQVAEVEPIAPRRHNPAIPRELETIVLKATAKEPGSRYATAQELADDLRRFLEHTPIRARWPGLMERASKWTRRHMGLVIAVMIILAVATTGLAIDYVRVAREQVRTSAALARAEDRSQLARRAVDEMYSEVAQKWLGNQPRQ